MNPLVDRRTGGTRGWHVGRSRLRGAGPSTSSSAPSPSPTRTPSRPSSTSSSARRSSSGPGSTSAGWSSCPATGSYFTKELAVARTSVVVVRGTDGEVRAFHNVCRHRGNKLVWNDYPQGGDQRRLPAVRVQVPRLALRPRRRPTPSSSRSHEFFDLDRADYGLVPVHCEVWAGFIFVNLAKGEPEQSLRDFLGPMVTKLENYPFDKLTERWFYRATVNEQLEALHGRLPGVLPRTRSAREADAAGLVDRRAAGRLRGAGLSDRRSAPPGEHGRHPPVEAAARTCSSRSSCITRSGLFGPWDVPDLDFDQKDAGINPAGCDPWGLDSFQSGPNFVILVWGQNWYLTYHYWPTAHNEHVFEGTLYFVPPKTPGSGWPRRTGGRHVQGVRTPGRQHARGDADRCSSPGCSSGSR